MLSLFGFRDPANHRQAMQNLEDYIRAYEPTRLQLPQDLHDVFDLLAQQGVDIPMDQRMLTIGVRDTLEYRGVEGLVRYLNAVNKLDIPINQVNNIGYLTNYLYDQFIATTNPAYENCLYLFTLAGHADAATKLGEHYGKEQYQNLAMAGYYYLVGAFLAKNSMGENIIDPVNAIHGAKLVITTQARTGQASPYLPLALAMLEHVVASDQSPTGLGQNAQTALSLLIDAHLMQVHSNSNAQVKALRFNPQLAVAVSGNTPNALGLALHFMQRYYPESDFQEIMLQLHYRLNTGYNAIGVAQVDFRNPQVELLACRLLAAVAPAAELLQGVEGERNSQSRIRELEGLEQVARLSVATPSLLNH